MEERRHSANQQHPYHSQKQNKSDSRGADEADGRGAESEDQESWSIDAELGGGKPCNRFIKQEGDVTLMRASRKGGYQEVQTGKASESIPVQGCDVESMQAS